MKRYISIVVIMIIFFNVFSNLVLASSSTDWKTAYKKYIEQVLTSEKEFPANIETLVLIDLDRDGIPELIGGQAYRMVSWIAFGETYRNGKTVSIYQSGVDNSNRFNIGMYAFLVNDSYSGIKLYKDRNTDEYKYIGSDGYSSAIDWGNTEYEIILNGSTLVAKEISSSQGPNPWSKDDPDVVEEFTFDKKVLSKKNYDKYRTNYYKNLVEVDHGAVTIPFSNLYDFNRNVPNEASIKSFLNSYSSSDTINLNQTPTSWAKSEVEQAVLLKIVPDDLQGGFTNRITRSDFCRLVMQMISIKTGKSLNELSSMKGNNSNTSAFKDTKDLSILAAYSLGIVNGKGKGLFDPDGNILRQEAAVMLARTAAVMNLNLSNSVTNFTDKGKIAEWAKNSISLVSSAKDSQNDAPIMSGTKSGEFSPKDHYTREQAIVTVKRLYNVQ